MSVCRLNYVAELLLAVQTRFQCRSPERIVLPNACCSQGAVTAYYVSVFRSNYELITCVCMCIMLSSVSMKILQSIGVFADFHFPKLFLVLIYAGSGTESKIS